LDADPCGGRVGHAREDGKRLDAVAPVPVERVIGFVRAEGAAHPAADEDSDAPAIHGGEVEARLAHGPASRHHGQLTDAIQHAKSRCWKMIFSLETHAGRERRVEPVRPGRLDPANGGATRGGIGERLGATVSERRDQADAGDGDAPHAGSAVCGRAESRSPFWAAMSPSTYFTASPRVAKVTPSEGRCTPNSSSMKKSISTMPRESMPRASSG